MAANVGVDVVMAPRQASAVDAYGHLIVDRLLSLGAGLVVSRDVEPVHELALRWRGHSVALSMGAPWIIRQPTIDAFEGRFVNTHAAPLPEWRGGGGFTWRMLADDRRGASCLHMMTTGIDDGDIVLRADYRFPSDLRLPFEWEAYALKHELAHLEAFVKGLVSGRAFNRTPQDHSQATYMPRLHANTHGWVDMTASVASIERFVVAFSRPYPGAQVLLNRSPVRIWDARATGDGIAPHPFMIGLVFRAAADAISIHGCDGGLSIRRSDIDAPRSLKVGDRLWTPHAVLDEAATTRVTYDVDGPKLPVSGSKT